MVAFGEAERAGTLHRIERDDAAAFAALASDYAPAPRSNEWLDADPSPAGIARFLENAVARRLQGRGEWVAIWTDEGLAGAIGMELLSSSAGIASVDYLLGPRFRGRGLATAAVGAFIDHLFRSTPLHRIEINPDVENKPSCAVADRLGFRREGVLRERLHYADGYGDQAVYALLRRDWAERAAEAGAARPRSP
ncbi:MAG: GNAT family N-acetyltransferase [Myxococcales bacterium]|nr:GNAT family N-acetyltransferase [Myxococcales bacterium]